VHPYLEVGSRGGTQAGHGALRRPEGSLELLSDPEEARKILDPVLELMMEAVHRYEDHAVRACYAALRMQETVKRHAESARRAEGAPVQIRVGLNSGEVVVRSIGSDLHIDYTAV
jgi:class 3 adenylate cyclase